MPSRNLAIIIITSVLSILCHQTASRNHFGGLLAAAIHEINSTFVRPVDQRDLFEGAMDGMVRQLDPYSDYITPDELVEFQQDLDQEFGGVGIVVEVNPDTNRLTVLSPLPDTPASSAGMRAGDQILEIDGTSTKDFRIHDAVDLMRGEPGTEVILKVLHAGDSDPVIMHIERAIIPVASVLGDLRNPDGTWNFILEDHPHIGLVRLTSFGEDTAVELRKTITQIKPQVSGLILDLRGNGGGLLSAAVDVCDLFVRDGKIVSIRGRGDDRDYSAKPETTICPDLPMVVLVDGFSASASEITAACLQDHDRAVIVGMRTWGKGTVQNVIPFEGARSALKLTVATYWRPSGKNIHRHVDATEEDSWGVRPTEGYTVETDDETMTKIILLRRERDKVHVDAPDAADSANIDPTVDPATNDDSNPNGDTAPEATSGDRSDGPQLPDITGFEDPQMKRAIEAIEELIGALDSAEQV